MVTMEAILAARKMQAQERQGGFHPAEPNKFRRFCKEKGIKGKGKKKFRKARKELASAKIALVNERTNGGLVNEAPDSGR